MNPGPSEARRRILDASINLVAEQGVRAVSFREVARRAGVSHQTPYHHFGDDVGILRAIAREGFAQLAHAMDEAAAREPDPVEALRAAGVAYVRFAHAHVGHFRVMFQSTVMHALGHDAMPEAEATYATLTRLTRAAHRAGAGRGLGVETMSHLAWATVHGLALLIIEGTLRSSPGNVTDDDALVRHVVGGLTRLLGATRPGPIKTSSATNSARPRKRQPLR